MEVLYLINKKIYKFQILQKYKIYNLFYLLLLLK